MVSLRSMKVIPVALILVTVAIAIAAMVSLARVVFFSDNANKVATPIDISKEALLSSDADHAVMLTVRGPIVADESFRSYQIKITANSRNLDVYSGYLDKSIGNISLTNNQKAYEQFVFALYKAGLIKGSELSGDNNDLRGICATGKIYDFKIIAGEKTEKDLWTSTCSGSKGSLAANVDQLVSLFMAQIPNSKDLIVKNW